MFKNLYLSALLGAAVLGIFATQISHPGWAEARAGAGEAPSHAWTTPTASAPAVSDNEVFKINKAFTDLAAKVSPAVVNIYTKTGMTPTGRLPHPYGWPGGGGEFDLFGPRPHEAQALGSGFVINTDGDIVTNAHVVTMAGRNADEIMVKFIGEESNKGHLAKIIGVDETSDVALLRLVEKKADLHVIPLGDSEQSRVGEWVVAIGNPYGHTNTVTQGIVSALGRSLEGARAEFMQTSASINPGNSGGPLINLSGEVIGINSAIDPRAQGIGFAIPINQAKTVITQLLEKGRVSRGWMGVAIEDLNDELAGYLKLQGTDGVLVKGVAPEQPAAKAGILAYDVIKSVNGKTIHTSMDLVRSIEGLSIGQTANIEVLRENQIRNVKVQIAEQPRHS